MIYCDGVHLISDVSVEDLHIQAEKLGINRCWFHSSSNYPHYDLPKRHRNKDFWFIQHPSVLRVEPRSIPLILRKAGLVK